MLLIADIHVHYYPMYDLERFVASSMENIKNASLFITTDVVGVLALAERRDMDFYHQLSAGRVKAPSGYSLTATRSGRGMVFKSEEGQCVYLAPGRQLVTNERLEVIGLGLSKHLADGLPLESAIELVISSGGVPVLPWGAGKWMGQRGRIIQKAMSRFGPERIWLCDSSLRPLLAPQPEQMKRARKEGFRVGAGSDPLPLKGEEKRVGQYVTAWKEIPSRNDAVECFFEMLTDASRQPIIVGRRCFPWTTLMRLMRYEISGRGGRIGRK